MKKKKTEKRTFFLWLVAMPSDTDDSGFNRFLTYTAIDTPTLFFTRKQAREARRELLLVYPKCGAKVTKAELSFNWKTQ